MHVHDTASTLTEDLLNKSSRVRYTAVFGGGGGFGFHFYYGLVGMNPIIQIFEVEMNGNGEMEYIFKSNLVLII